MNQQKKTKIIIITMILLALLFFADKIAQAQMNYLLLEEFPGFFGANTSDYLDLPTFILAIYKFGIWTVGIAGLLMLTVGGFMYMTSAGNTSRVGSAKGIITDAIIGIIAALAAYLIMWVINPDLTQINIGFAKLVIPSVTTYGGSTGVGNPVATAKGCKDATMLETIKAASAAAVPSVDGCLTFALLNTESGCRTNVKSGAGACGISQLMPATAGVSCETLNNNPSIAISKGLTYFNKVGTVSPFLIRGSLGASDGTPAKNQAIRDKYAAYNGGPGCLGASNDCPTGMNSYGYPYKKWDCNINPGGYVETQVATARFLSSYNACRTDASIRSAVGSPSP